MLSRPCSALLSILSGFWMAVGAVPALASDADLSQVQLPSLMVVEGVPVGDVLNIRAEPDGASEDLGDLNNGDRIEATGLDDSGKWVRVIVFEGDGWLSARFLQPLESVDDSRSGMPYPLQCGGTEPFWTFKIGTEGALQWSTLDIASLAYTIDWATRSRSLGSHAYALGSGPFTAVVHRRECSDGMSDRTYGWSMDLVRKEGRVHEHFAGCCRWQN